MKQNPFALASLPNSNQNDTSKRKIIAIVDTNVVLSCIRHDCLKGKKSQLLQSTLFGSTALYAAEHVYHEIYEHLPKFVVAGSVSLAQLTARFESEYLSVIRFVTLSTLEYLDPQVLAIPDLDDRPTGQLAQLLAPAVVYSEDKKGLIRPGFAHPEWRATTSWTASVARITGEERVTASLVSGAIVGVSSISNAFGRKFKLPRWLPAVTFVGLGIYAVLQTPKRRAAAKKIGARYGEHFMNQNQQRLDDFQEISKIVYPRSNFPTLRQQLAYILARSDEPMLARDIRDQMAEHVNDFPTPLIRELLATLTDGLEFVRVGPSRWQLGREVGPRY